MMVGLESCVTTMTRKPMPYESGFNQEYKPIKNSFIVGEASMVTTMTRVHRPNPTKIIYEGLAVVQDVEFDANPSMNDSFGSDGNGQIIGLGSIVSNNPVQEPKNESKSY